MLSDLKKWLKRVFKPHPRCLMCGSFYCNTGYPFCKSCSPKFIKLLKDGCLTCGCPPWDCKCFQVKSCLALYWLFSYNGENARSIIYFLKRRASGKDYDYLSRRLEKQIRAVSGGNVSFDCVCYVPRSPQGLKMYGYDHGRLLGQAMAKRFGVSCLALLVHTGAEGEQKRLSRKYRDVAAKTRFAANSELLKDGKLPFKRVLLVDDIVTTGATMGGCASILKHHGVKQVFGAFIAHTPDWAGAYKNNLF